MKLNEPICFPVTWSDILRKQSFHTGYNHKCLMSYLHIDGESMAQLTSSFAINH